MKVWTKYKKNKECREEKRDTKVYTGSPSNLRVHPVPSLLEGFHYDLYKVKQENNPLFFTLLFPTILDNKVIPYKVKQENNPLFFTLLLPIILDSKMFTIIRIVYKSLDINLSTRECWYNNMFPFQYNNSELINSKCSGNFYLIWNYAGKFLRVFMKDCAENCY